MVFPPAAFVLFRDLSHKNAWINHTCVPTSHFPVILSICNYTTTEALHRYCWSLSCVSIMCLPSIHHHVTLDSRLFKLPLDSLPLHHGK